jgi:hypothetical protein
MRELSIVIAFLALLLTGCGANTAAERTPPQETTADIAATGSTQPETTLGTAVVLEERTETTTEAAPPPETRTPDTVAPAGQVTAIGDSVMKGAVGTLQQEVPNLGVIDVQGSLQAPAAIGILRQRRAAGQLGDVVVVHIGNNVPFSAEKFQEMMQVLASVRKVLVVNMVVPRHGVDNPVAVPNNSMLAERVRRYPNAVLVDWHAASVGHPEFAERGGIHLTLQGAQAYADLTARYLADPVDEGDYLTRALWSLRPIGGVGETRATPDRCLPPIQRPT